MSWSDLEFGAEELPLESEDAPIMEEPLWLFTASFDNTCPTCGALDGQVFPDSILDEAFSDLEELAEGVIAPHVHINCQCQLVMEPSAEEDPIEGGFIEDGGLF